ncbi:MAG: hypothetical protein HUU16_18065 [Candidatus Omnitrophica bacterium]|nr:hypothetical protein [Candidatus Omnitrophota bacterium]
MGILLILAVIFTAISLYTPSFASRSNLSSIIQAISPIALMAIGQTFVILTAGIDLSVGSVCALSAYMMSLVLISEDGYPLWVGLAVALGTGGFCGLLSGLIITKLRVTPFIVTLGMLSACSGLTLGLSGGKQISLGKFGKAVEESASILSPSGEVAGQPAVERRFYGESASVDAIQPTRDGGAWLGAASPGSVTLLGANWEPRCSVNLNLEEVSALAPIEDAAVLAAGSPGGKVYRIEVGGASTLFCDTGAGAVEAITQDNKGSFRVGTREPAAVLQVSREGEVLSRIPLGESKAVTSLALDRSGKLFIATEGPGSILGMNPGASPEVVYSATATVVEQLKIDSENRLWFVEGEEKPNRLMVLDQGKADLVWISPKPPIRSFLAYAEQVALVSTGNVGALYLLRPGFEPSMIHPMTTFKARTLVDAGPSAPIFVGNSGPGGLATLETTATLTRYPVAEAFNEIHRLAPLTMAVLICVAWLFLRFTTWGTYLYAIGGNEQAARLSGIRVDRMKVFVYTVTGVLCGLASVFLTSKLHTLDPNLAKGYELKVIAAVVIGGTSLMGGQGSVWGTLIGATLLYVLNYSLVHLGMEDIWSDLFIGIVIILAAIIDSLRSRFGEWIGFSRRQAP